MAKNKLRQFAELLEFPNVIQHPFSGPAAHDHPVKGSWSKQVFGDSNHPVVVELGCGKGEYTLALAKSNPLGVYVGIDRKGNRIWRGAKTALSEPVPNAYFLRTPIEELHHCFAEEEIDRIWITFPDPQPGLKREKKRLTAPDMLSRYTLLLKPGGALCLKTDSRELWEYSIEQIHEFFLIETLSEDLYHDKALNKLDEYGSLTGIQTFYEKKYLAEGKPICFIKATKKNM